MKNEHVIETEVKGKDWESALDTAFKKQVKNTKIDGFRKGSVPKDIYLKKTGGVQVLYNDAIDIVLPDVYNKTIRDSKLIPVCEPKIDIKAIDSKHIKFQITIITKPEVKLGKYKDLGIKRDAIKVTKKEIDEEVARLCNQLAEIVIKEKGEVLEGNTAVIDFEGFVDGEPLESGTSANYPLEIGSHTFIPGFEEGIVGMKVGETKELKLNFPKDYVKDLAGKEVIFKVTLREIKERVLPKLDKSFYEDLGYENIETEEEFNKEVKNAIEERKKVEAEDKYIGECLEAASKNMKCDINEEIIDEEVHRMLRQFSEQLKMQGITLEQYMQFSGMKEEDFHKQMEPEAKKRVSYRYLLEGIAEAEKIEFDDKEAKKEAEKMAEDYGLTKEDFLVQFGGLDVVKYDMKMRRAMEILKEN